MSSTAPCPRSSSHSHAADFDRWIDHDGGLDVQLLGIGRNGHIAFNEPSDLSVERALELPTRLVDLHPVTRADAAREFGGDDQRDSPRPDHGPGPDPGRPVDRRAGHRRPQSRDHRRGLQGPLTAENPASLLRTAGDRVTWLLDEAAAKGLG